MKRRCLLLLFAMLAAAPLPARAQVPTDAYLDDDARELVRLARLRRNTVDRRIESYATTARERISVGLRAGIAQKLLYRRETVSRIDWQRDGPVHLEVLASREVVPPASAAPQIPVGLDEYVPHLAFDPIGSDVFMRFDSTSLRHPLLEGSEQYYRFAAGDTTIIRLPDGRTVRLRELRVIPRRRDPRLINGSFWLDADTHAVVQAYFKLARAYDADIDDDDAPGFLKPIRADLDFVAVEYGLWERHWWLPRLVATKGMVQVGRVRVPLSYERSYEAYTVRGDTASAVPVAVDTAQARPCRPPFRFAVVVKSGGGSATSASDSARQARSDSTRARRERERRAAGDTTSIEEPPCEREFTVALADDSLLLNSPELPASVYGDDIALMSDDELQALVDRVRTIPAAPWRLEAPRWQWGLTGPGLVRYNRVEGLSVGGRLLFDLGPANLDAVARIGLADREPRGELALDRRGDRFQSRLAAYRRLQAVPEMSGSGFRESLVALLIGREDHDFFDTHGAELVVRPAETAIQWYDVRFYAERQRALERNTDFSVPHLIDSDHTFRPNFSADAADQVGARVRLRTALGVNPAAPRFAVEVSLGAEAGDFTFFRPEAVARVSTPLPFGFTYGTEAAVGTAEGTEIPAQALWRLGGPSTLRGYAGNTLAGERYWRARVELGRGIQAAKLTLFSDAAWAGPRNHFDADGALWSAGAGVSLLDGLLRVDLARGLRAPRGWRLHLYFNGVI